MANEEKNKRMLHNAFKLNGFNIRREFCGLIVQELKLDECNNAKLDSIVIKICNSLENQCLLDKSIELENIKRAIKACEQHGYDSNESIFNVINAFEFPKLSYNPDRKQYYPEKNKSVILSNAEVKANLFLERYATVLQRTKRSFEQKGGKKLQTVDYLLTISNIVMKQTFILGALFQISEGKWYLEDPTGMVELNLLHAEFKIGFFNESCLVLVDGYYEDRIICVSSIKLPPGEEYNISRPLFGNINYFGGPSNIPLKDSARLSDYMTRNKSKYILFFSDVWLDHPQVFEKLECLFNGFQDCPPEAFVFMGNFMSSCHGTELMEEMKKLFKKLAELILKFPKLSNISEFVFVPGLADPCMPHIVPRFSLPSYVTSDMKKILPKAIFATNPCRIQYCTREIVVFRADLMPKLLQGTLHKPSKEEIPESIITTIISQGHLSPLPLNSMTVQWGFDHCLRLYPLPDLVVIGDKCEAYDGSNKDCIVINPGPFCESGFQFLSYRPYTNTVDDCTL